MKVLNNAPISRKLTMLVVAAVTVALALCCMAFVIDHVYYMRAAMVRQLTALAEVLGSNTTAAVTFDDSDSAGQILESLKLQPMVESACIYDAAGDVFATFSADGSEPQFPPIPRQVGHQFTAGGFLDVSQRLVANEESIGTIYLHASLDEIRNEFMNYAVIVILVMIVSFAAAYFLASRLQHAISGPILALARTAERISIDKNYSIRVQKVSDDELGVLYDSFNRMLEQVQMGKHQLQEAHNKLELRVAERTRQLSDTNHELSQEVAERRKTEQELERVHREFVEAARRAGMAEIASGVLHNVGNVLNSVNVSAATLANQLKTSKRSQLDRLVAMLEEHAADVGQFLTEDEKGKQIPNFLKLLTGQLKSEEQALLAETGSLTKNIEHIKAIIATQQSYAGTSGVVEPMDINTLFEDAVKLNSASFARHHITVQRELAQLPPVLVDKQRLLQIVINLVKNAKESLLEQPDRERVLTIRTRVDADWLVIEVHDTGVGIEKENLTRVFSHGFTTKKSGHGFGLHSCANSAAEMDGLLSVHSEGRSQGATFTLKLPYTPANVHACAVVDNSLSENNAGVTI
jgi:C4-dicarboxylate-specific signal transduction histidine kinase